MRLIVPARLPDALRAHLGRVAPGQCVLVHAADPGPKGGAYVQVCASDAGGLEVERWVEWWDGGWYDSASVAGVMPRLAHDDLAARIGQGIRESTGGADVHHEFSVVELPEVYARRKNIADTIESAGVWRAALRVGVGMELIRPPASTWRSFMGVLRGNPSEAVIDARVKQITTRLLPLPVRWGTPDDALVTARGRHATHVYDALGQALYGLAEWLELDRRRAG